MKLHELFGGASTGWAGYDGYIIIEDNGSRYVTPSMGAKLRDYDPLEVSADIVPDAVNVGLLCGKRTRNQAPVEEAILGFCAKYGLLGFMCALPTTPDFWEYDIVYIPKNPVVKDTSMGLKDFEMMFFPKGKEDMLFDKAKVMKELFGNLIPGDEPLIGVGERDSYGIMQKFRDLPFAQRHGFKRGYAEPYEWLHNQFRDWGSIFLSSILYDEERDEDLRDLHSYALTVYKGVAPHYNIFMDGDMPTLKWDFHSLLQAVQLMLCVMLTDRSRPLRLCPECEKAFYAAHARSVFCSAECKARHGIGKTRP